MLTPTLFEAQRGSTRCYLLNHNASSKRWSATDLQTSQSAKPFGSLTTSYDYFVILRGSYAYKMNQLGGYYEFSPTAFALRGSGTSSAAKYPKGRSITGASNVKISTSKVNVDLGFSIPLGASVTFSPDKKTQQLRFPRRYDGKSPIISGEMTSSNPLTGRAGGRTGLRSISVSSEITPSGSNAYRTASKSWTIKNFISYDDKAGPQEISKLTRYGCSGTSWGPGALTAVPEEPGANQAPTAKSAVAGVCKGRSHEGTIAGNASDPEGGPLQFKVVGQSFGTNDFAFSWYPDGRYRITVPASRETGSIVSFNWLAVDGAGAVSPIVRQDLRASSCAPATTTSTSTTPPIVANQPPTARASLNGACRGKVNAINLANMASDPDGDNLRFEIKDRTFSVASFRETFDPSRGGYTLTIPTSVATGTIHSFLWRAIDARGAASPYVKQEFRAASC